MNFGHRGADVWYWLHQYRDLEHSVDLVPRDSSLALAGMEGLWISQFSPASAFSNCTISPWSNTHLEWFVVELDKCVDVEGAVGLVNFGLLIAQVVVSPGPCIIQIWLIIVMILLVAPGEWHMMRRAMVLPDFCYMQCFLVEGSLQRLGAENYTWISLIKHFLKADHVL